MSPRNPTAWMLAAAFVVAGPLAMGTAGAVPVEATPAVADTVGPRIVLGTAELVIVDDPARPLAEPAPADPATDLMQMLADAGSAQAAPTVWSPEGLAGDVASFDDGRMFAVSVNDLFALPAAGRIDVLAAPGTVGLLGAGLLGLALLARRPRRLSPNRSQRGRN